MKAAVLLVRQELARVAALPAVTTAEFLGVVVSIFGGDGTLLYQGASQNALEKCAATRVPTPVKNDMRRDFRARFE
jgi:hypothetical protein